MTLDERIKGILIQRFKRAAESILLYLSYRRDPNIKDNFGTTLLHMVASASLDNLAIMQYLLGLGARINDQDNNLRTPLHLAIMHNNFKVADFLITQGAAVNVQEKKGRTALHLLIDDLGLLKLKEEREKANKSLLLLKKLLQSGADPNVPDAYGETPLMRAVRQNDFTLGKELLKFGGNVYLRNTDSDTCLHLLLWSFEPKEDILVELVKRGACLNCFGSCGNSVIDFILQNYPVNEGLKTVKLLIKIATLVNWKNKICFNLDTNLEFSFLEEFINSCYTEVCQMKSCSYFDKSNLCQFTLNGGNASLKDNSSGKNIFDAVLETLTKDNFPIYDDYIRVHFDRTFLLEKLLKINTYTINVVQKKKIFIHLNYDTKLEVVSYLKDEDLYNLVRAYSKPDMLRIKNDNQTGC